MDNYVLRLKPEAVRKYLEIIREKFTSSVAYCGRSYHWDTIIQLKTQELAKFILGKKKKIDFSNPSPYLVNVDDKEFRGRILSLSTGEARKIGIRKNTLWNLKKRVREKKSLKTYSKVSKKLAIN